MIIRLYLLYCMHGVNGSFKQSYHSPCVTVPILSCSYGRGRELWAIGRLEPASAGRTDKEVRAQCDASIFLFKSLWPIWLSIENGSANSVDYLPSLASMYFGGWRRSASWRAGWKALSNCLSRFSWVIPGAPLLMNYFPRNVKSHLLTEMKTG